MTEDEKQSIENRVLHIIESQAGWAKPEDITGNMVLEDSPLHMDSLDMVELFMGLEEEFEIEIPDGDVAETLKTIQDVIDYITKRKEEM